MTDPFFKIRPSKRSNPESRTTLDTVHQHNLTKIKDLGEQITSWKQHHKELVGQYRAETDDIERYKLEQEIKTAQDKLESTDEKTAMFDYFLENGDLLFQYYDIQDRINRGADNVVHVGDRARPGSVFEALENASRQDASGVKLATGNSHRENGGGGDTLECKPGEEVGEDPDEVFEANVADKPSDIEPEPLDP